MIQTIHSLPLTPLPVRLPCHALELTHRRIDELELLASILPPGTPISIPSWTGDKPSTLLAMIEQVHLLGYLPIPHIAARRFRDRQSLASLLERAAGRFSVDRILLIAGDEPVAQGSFHSTQCVIETGMLEGSGIRHVGIAGYPEGHPRIASPAIQSALLDKCAALAARGIGCSITTQLSVRPAAVRAWIASVRQAGVRVPIAISIPGPAEPDALRRFVEAIGVNPMSSDADGLGNLGRGFTAAGQEGFFEWLLTMLPVGQLGETGLNVLSLGATLDTAAWFSHLQTGRWVDDPIETRGWPETGIAPSQRVTAEKTLSTTPA